MKHINLSVIALSMMLAGCGSSVPAVPSSTASLPPSASPSAEAGNDNDIKLEAAKADMPVYPVKENEAAGVTYTMDVSDQPDYGRISLECAASLRLVREDSSYFSPYGSLGTYYKGSYEENDNTITFHADTGEQFVFAKADDITLTFDAEHSSSLPEMDDPDAFEIKDGSVFCTDDTSDPLMQAYWKASEAASWFRYSTMDETDETGYTDGMTVYKVRDFETMDDVRTYLSELFSADLVEKLVSDSLMSGDYYEIDGRLFTVPADFPGASTNGYSTFEEEYVSDSQVNLNMSRERREADTWYLVTGYDDYTFTYEKQDGHWIFTSFPETD